MITRICSIIFLLYSISISAQETFSFQDCINYALKNNIQVQKSKLSIEQSRYDLEQRRANQLPSLSGSMSQGFNFGNSLDYTTYEYVKKSTNSNYFHLGSEMLLFKGLQVQNNIKAGKHLYEARNASLEDVRDQISLDVVTTYLQILMNQEEIENAENQLLLTNKLLEKTKVLIEVGEEKYKNFPPFCMAKIQTINGTPQFYTRP